MIMKKKQQTKRHDERDPKQKDMPSFAEVESKKMQYGQK